MKKLIIGFMLLIVIAILAYPYYLANQYKSRLGQAKNAEEVLALVDLESLKASVTESFKHSIQKQAEDDPMAGMAMAFIEPMTEQLVSMMLNKEHLQKMLAGADMKALSNNMMSADSESWKWVYFTGVNSFRVATKDADFNFESKDGNWILKTVNLAELRGESNDDKVETSTKSYSSDGSVIEIADTDKYGEELVVPFIAPTSLNIKNESELKKLLSNSFFVSNIFSNELNVISEFSQVPFDVGYTVSWNNVVDLNDASALSEQLTEQQQNEVDKQSEEYHSNFKFNGGRQTKIYLKDGIKEEDLKRIGGDINFKVPAEWVELSLMFDGKWVESNGFSFKAEKESTHRVKLSYKAPKEIEIDELIFNFTNKSGQSLKNSSLGGSSMSDDKVRSGNKTFAIHGLVDKLEIFVPLEFSQFEMTVQVHKEPRAKSAAEVKVPKGVVRYSTHAFDSKYEKVELDDFVNSIKVSSHREKSNWSFNKPFVKLEFTEIDNNRHIKTSLKGLVPSFADNKSHDFKVERSMFNAKSLSLSINNKDWQIKEPLPVQYLKGVIEVDYPVEFETIKIPTSEEMAGLNFFPSAISFDSKQYSHWQNVRAYDKNGGRLLEVNNALPHNWNKVEKVYWGEIAYIEFDQAIKWEKFNYPIDISIPDPLPESCMDSKDC